MQFGLLGEQRFACADGDGMDLQHRRGRTQQRLRQRRGLDFVAGTPPKRLHQAAKGAPLPWLTPPLHQARQKTPQPPGSSAPQLGKMTGEAVWSAAWPEGQPGAISDRNGFREAAMANEPALRGYVVGPGEGVPDRTPEVKASGRSTGGSLTVMELAVDGGPPRHTHTREDESFYVFTGVVDVECGAGHRPRARPGRSSAAAHRPGRAPTACARHAAPAGRFSPGAGAGGTGSARSPTAAASRASWTRLQVGLAAAAPQDANS